MEQDKHVNPWGLTGDPERDRQRKSAMLHHVNRLLKEFRAGQQTDLLADLGGAVKPIKSKKFKKDKDTIMKALALDLADYIPEDMAQFYGFTTRPESAENPRVPAGEDDWKAPF